MGVKPVNWPPAQSDLILDGLIGYSLRGTPRGRACELIQWANEMVTPVLSLDVPSGFDSGTGSLTSVTIHATATLTLALPKRGLQAPEVRHAVGNLYLADISVPAPLYQRLSVPRLVPSFSTADILRLPT